MYTGTWSEHPNNSDMAFNFTIPLAGGGFYDLSNSEVRISIRNDRCGLSYNASSEENDAVQIIAANPSSEPANGQVQVYIPRTVWSGWPADTYRLGIVIKTGDDQFALLQSDLPIVCGIPR